jgi:hypothetical protein
MMGAALRAAPHRADRRRSVSSMPINQSGYPPINQSDRQHSWCRHVSHRIDLHGTSRPQAAPPPRLRGFWILLSGFESLRRNHCRPKVDHDSVFCLACTPSTAWTPYSRERIPASEPLSEPCETGARQVASGRSSDGTDRSSEGSPGRGRRVRGGSRAGRLV